jgi:hypothetical protein
MSTVPVEAGAPRRWPVVRTAAAWFAVPLVGSALLGLLAGFIWGEVAPRALLQEIGVGTAELVNAETTAFIAADAWFCVIGAAAGLIAGMLGYWFLLAPRAATRGARDARGGQGAPRARGPRNARPAGGARAAAAAGLILGGLVGALVMLWLGQQVGLSGYDHHLAASPNGTFFPASLTLGAKSALAFWPMVTAIIILVSEWGTARVQHADGSAAGRPSS